MCSWHCFGGPGYSWSILQGSHGSWKVVKNEKKIRHVEVLKLAVGPEKRMIFYCGICVGTLILPVAWLQWFLFAPPPRGVSSHADSLNTAPTKSRKRSWSPCESVNSHLVEECYLKVSGCVPERDIATSTQATWRDTVFDKTCATSQKTLKNVGLYRLRTVLQPLQHSAFNTQLPKPKLSTCTGKSPTSHTLLRNADTRN